MSYDLQEIKERLDLVELFRRDDHDLRRLGANHFVCCPFHHEDSPSCKVDSIRFHCFGCGAAGDIFDYWERSRNVAKADAIGQLARLAGISPDVPGFTKPLPRPQPQPREQDAIPPLTPAGMSEWLSGVETLRSQPHQIARIASWRGYSEDTVRWAAGIGVMGLYKWSGIWREAFLVEMPQAPSGPFIPVSVHIRLGPNTKGNPHPKQSWRFAPSGRGSWPLIFGTLHTARQIFLVEGQWDALALIDLMGWHREWPATLAVVAIRGSSSFEKLLTHYAFHDQAAVFAIADADLAGSTWFQDGGFLHRLTPRVGRLFAFWPGETGLDLNDLLRRGLDRAAMLAVLQPKLPSRRHRAPTGPTFIAWCRGRKGWTDSIGRAARTVLADPRRPRGRARRSTWLRHWDRMEKEHALTSDLHADLRAAWDLYTSECYPS